MNEVIKDYAHQYSHYSSYFVRYLNGSIRSLKNPQHKESLRKNVIEEVGDKNSIDLAKKPHVEIFNHFKKTILMQYMKKITLPLPPHCYGEIFFYKNVILI